MACAIRVTDEIKRIQIPGSEYVLESKISYEKNKGVIYREVMR
jgi:hypothetical protein